LPSTCTAAIKLRSCRK